MQYQILDNTLPHRIHYHPDKFLLVHSNRSLLIIIIYDIILISNNIFLTLILSLLYYCVNPIIQFSILSLPFSFRTIR